MFQDLNTVTSIELISQQGMLVANDCYGPFICKLDLFNEIQDPKRRVCKSDEKHIAHRLCASWNACKDFSVYSLDDGIIEDLLCLCKEIAPETFDRVSVSIKARKILDKIAGIH